MLRDQLKLRTASRSTLLRMWAGQGAKKSGSTKPLPMPLRSMSWPGSNRAAKASSYAATVTYGSTYEARSTAPGQNSKICTSGSCSAGWRAIGLLRLHDILAWLNAQVGQWNDALAAGRNCKTLSHNLRSLPGRTSVSPCNPTACSDGLAEAQCPHSAQIICAPPSLGSVSKHGVNIRRYALQWHISARVHWSRCVVSDLAKHRVRLGHSAGYES